MEVHTKNKITKRIKGEKPKIYINEQKLADYAMSINHTRLVLLKRWYFSMFLKMSMKDASLIFLGRLFNNLGPI